MQPITLSVDNQCYLITLAAGLFNNLNTFKLLDHDQQALVITNETVAPLYLDKICAQLSMSGARVDSLVLPDGEQHKTWVVLEQIFSALLEQRHSRDTTLLALGGGVIGDLTGFAAACYQRGVRYLQLPTTLLAQVDAAIGGKTAINHLLGKNMIGAFHQPAAVLIDIDTLSTLPPRQLAAGLAEVIKYGMVLDESFFCWLEQHIEAILQLQPPALMTAIRRCCELKTAVVALDERDHGQRLLLNFGHTFAHAIEAHSRYSSWLHGEAVSVGMIMAALTAERLGLIEASAVERLQALLQRVRLPIIGPSSMQFEDYWPYLSRDKKVSGGQMRLVLPTAVGHAVVVGQPPIGQVDTQTLREVIDACR